MQSACPTFPSELIESEPLESVDYFAAHADGYADCIRKATATLSQICMSSTSESSVVEVDLKGRREVEDRESDKH